MKDDNSLSCHSRVGYRRGFALHAVRLRNDWLLQKPMRPARGNPDRVNKSITAQLTINFKHVACLDSRLSGNDGIVSCLCF
jgi:hypothetical protein